MPEKDENAKGEVETTTKGDQKQQEHTLTQADVDRIVQDRVARVEAKYADYDDLKKKAGDKETLDEKVAELEKKYQTAEAARLRSDVAAKYGISAEDRDLFLTGTDEAALTAQAKRLGEREADRKRQGNVAPKEGGTSSSGKDDSDEREFVKQLFGKAE